MHVAPGLPPNRLRGLFHGKHSRVASYDGEPALVHEDIDETWVLRWGPWFRDGVMRVTWIWTRLA